MPQCPLGVLFKHVWLDKVHNTHSINAEYCRSTFCVGRRDIRAARQARVSDVWIIHTNTSRFHCWATHSGSYRVELQKNFSDGNYQN